MARHQPTGNIVEPGTVGRGLSSHKIGDILLKRISVFDDSSFSVEMIFGHYDVAWITNDVNNPAIAGIKIVMTFDNSGSWCPVQISLWRYFGIGNNAIDPVEFGLPFRVQKVCNQEPAPGIPRLGVRN